MATNLIRISSQFYIYWVRHVLVLTHFAKLVIIVMMALKTDPTVECMKDLQSTPKYVSKFFVLRLESGISNLTNRVSHNPKRSRGLSEHDQVQWEEEASTKPLDKTMLYIQLYAQSDSHAALPQRDR